MGISLWFPRKSIGLWRRNFKKGIYKMDQRTDQKSLTSLNVGSTVLSNRYVMGSMHTGLEDDLRNIEALKEYFVTRAKGQVGMIITGGYSPNIWGRLTPFAGTFSNSRIAKAHAQITQAVHAASPTKILLQLLHAGRYSYHPFSMAPSRLKSPITPFTPFAMPVWMIKKTISDFIKAAGHAKDAGYDGVEVMGSEGYLLHQFFAEKTNIRKDEWGGTLANRARFSLEIVSGIRKKMGPDFLIVFRVPIIDLLPDGSEWSDVVWYAKKLEEAGVSILNSGIGWHESRVPTIASVVPEAAFSSITADLRKNLKVPVIASNRFSHPDSAEKAIREGKADLISMARPFLADPEFVQKTLQSKVNEINPCIACNQACLDHIFSNKKASCLVNPLAAEEKKWALLKTEKVTLEKKIAVVGGGAAGMNAALVLLQRGHSVTVFEQKESTGGQFILAALIPGKADYGRSIKYWQNQLTILGGQLVLKKKVITLDELSGFDHVVIATGVKPRQPKIEGIELPHVYFYDDFLNKGIQPKQKIVIIGAGGIGVDIACYVTGKNSHKDSSAKEFFKHWNIDPKVRGGLIADKKYISHSKITLLQRSEGGLGKGLGKTTGWIHRLELKKQGVKFINNLDYHRITSDSVEVRLKSGEFKKIEADQVIICAGQESVMELVPMLVAAGKPFSVIGGAKLAGELDAKRAIREAYELIFSI